jgi:hypothetical protein
MTDTAAEMTMSLDIRLSLPTARERDTPRSRFVIGKSGAEAASLRVLHRWW